jgi:hypothetical protein
MYTDPSSVRAVFNGSTDLAGQNVDIFLTKTSPTELRNIIHSVINGNTRPFRNLLNSSIYRSLNLALDPNGDKKIDFGILRAGDYVTIVMQNESNPDNLTVLSFTTFQVLEYTSRITAPARVKQGEDIKVKVNIKKVKNAASKNQGEDLEDNVEDNVDLNSPQGENYTYGAFLIHEESYKENLQLKSNGTEAGTNLSVNDESLIVGFKIAGIGLNKVNKSTVQKIAEGAIGANNGTVLLKTTANNLFHFL